MAARIDAVRLCDLTRTIWAAARALSRLVDAGLVVRHCRRSPGGEFLHSLYELRLESGDGIITVVAPAPGPTSACAVLGDTDTDTDVDARPRPEVKGPLGRTGPRPRPA